MLNALQVQGETFKFLLLYTLGKIVAVKGAVYKYTKYICNETLLAYQLFLHVHIDDVGRK